MSGKGSSKMDSKSVISLKEIYRKYFPDFSNFDSQYLPLYSALLIGVLTLLYILLRLFRGKSRRSGIAILGLCESGKTQLFSQLCYEMDVLTVTSTKESSGLCMGEDKKSTLIFDVPGHDRIRYNLFEKVKDECKGIIYMLDASTIQKDIRDVAEYLYNILCDGAVQKKKCPLLIICNKQDLATAKGAPLIKSSLEKEMNLLRITQANQLQSVGEKGNNSNFLGKEGIDFEFSHLGSIRTTFVEAVSKGDLQIDQVHNWLRQF